MLNWRRNLFVVCYLLISPIFLIIVLELGLWGAHAVTGHHRLSPLEVKANTVPVGDDAIKIAIYGGSSAAGYNSEATLNLIMEGILAKAYPDQNFHIKNFARNGAPFYRHQAEQLKLSMDDFDVHLVYAGHNEALNYYDDVGYFRAETDKSNRELTPPGEDSFSLVEWFRNKSRIFAIAEKSRIKYLQGKSTRTPELLKYIPPRPDLFEESKSIPPEILANIPVHFEASVREIGALAEAKDKTVIFSNLPLHEEYSPLFSVFSFGIGDTEKTTFKALYDSGVEAYNSRNYSSAVNDFLAAAEIDDQPAILNYRLGRTYLELGELDAGRLHIQKSIDNDGLPIRSLSSLAEILSVVAEEVPSVRFIDSVNNFRIALDKGLTNDELFADFHHPNAVGHLIIALGFIAEMQRLRPLKDLVISGELPAIERDSLDDFIDTLGVPNWWAQRLSFLRMRWHLFIGQLAAEPGDYADQSDRHIDDYLELSEQLPRDLALASMFHAYVAAQIGDISRATDLVENSLRISPSLVNDLLNGEVYVGSNYLTGNWNDEFAKIGLIFSKTGSMLSDSQ